MRVLPRYIAGNLRGEITFIDERLTVVLQDTPNQFWPVIVRMDSAFAQTFMADLARVITQKSEVG